MFKKGDTVRIMTGGYEGFLGKVGYAMDSNIVVTPEGKGVPLQYKATELTLADDTPPFGMSPNQLALEVATQVERATLRIRGVGAEQYSEMDRQKFEEMPVRELIEYTLEELDDVINYSVMLGIRLRRLRQELLNKGVV